MGYLFCESLTPRNTYIMFLRNIVGETVVSSHDLNLKKNHILLKKKKKSAIFTKGGIVEIWILIQAQIPSEKYALFLSEQ